ncbi:MAG TPA: carboxypeptidase-like regulatory domain-containing protein [Candidatus Angelobacter sp.]
MQSTTEIADEEKRLLLMPEEVFRGEAAIELTVLTSQGDCLPEILPGDRWLFYLQRVSKTNALLLSYGSPSEPLADAQKQIAMLRRQVQMAGAGIVKGHVQRRIRDDKDNSEEFFDVSDHKITAKRVPDGTEYTALTDSNGNYEFEPLPSGTYDLSANTAKGLWAEEGSTDVQPRSCSYVGFQLRPVGMISGRIRNASGRPFRYAHVQLTPALAAGSELTSATADENGYFEIRGLRPGRYLLGINIDAQKGTPEWQKRVYYPGVRNRALAVAIEVGEAKKRMNLDFQVPAN